MSTQGMRRSRRSFSPQFKAEAVAMVLELKKPIAHVARDLELNETTLGRWVAKWRADHGDGSDDPLSPRDVARLGELERENRELRLELAFVKKAAAFFAKELPSV